MNLHKIKEMPICSTLLSISFIFSGLIMNIVQLLLYAGLKPFNKSLFRKINYYFSYSFHSQLVFAMQWWGNGDVTIYVDKEVYAKYCGKEHTYLLSNHHYELDWMVIFSLTDCVGVLGNCKCYTKKFIQHIPSIGWMWKFCDFLFLDRSFDKDSEIISRHIKDIQEYPDPIWMGFFAEGTRFTSKKSELSQKFARERKLPYLQYHLTPRTKGFSTVIKTLESDKFPAIYDVSISFDKNAEVKPTLKNVLLGKKISAHVYINRLPLEGIPTGEKESAEWLHNLFALKDRMQASFHNTGDYFKESGEKRVDSFLLPRRVYPLLNTIFWNSVTVFSIVYWLTKLFINRELFLLSISIGLLGIIYFLMHYLIGITQISNASTYGMNKKSD